MDCRAQSAYNLRKSFKERACPDLSILQHLFYVQERCLPGLMLLSETTQILLLLNQ